MSPSMRNRARRRNVAEALPTPADRAVGQGEGPLRADQPGRVDLGVPADVDVERVVLGTKRRPSYHPAVNRAPDFPAWSQ